MHQRLSPIVLEDVVLSQDAVTIASWKGKTFHTTAERITPPDAFGVSQYTSEKINVAIDGKCSEAVLDFLVEGELARVSLNGVYHTSIPVSPSLIEQDAFPVMYTTEHSEGLPLTLLFIGENQITAASHKQREEDHSPAPPQDRESPEILYTPLVSDSTTHVSYTLEEKGLVTLVKDVAHLDRNALWLKTRYANPAQASSFLTQKIEKLGLAIYWQNRRWGGRNRKVLIPRGSEEMIYPGLTLGKYEDIPLVAVDCAREYATAKGIETFIPKFLKVVHLKGKRYYFAAELDDFQRII
jgi:hypothetical protein